MANAIPHYPMVIDGQPLGNNPDTTILDPFDGTPVGTCPEAGPDDVERAVRAARAAQAGWAARPDDERAALCRAVAQAFEAHAEELATLITREQGKPLDAGGFGSRFEVGGCIGWSMATAALSLPDRVVLDENGVRAVEERVPKGVVASITPWNWPVLIAVWHLLPAIRTGNTVVMKPSPFTPLSTLRMAAILNDVLPNGVFNVVTGGGEIGGQLTAHPDVDKVIFTGSTATGKRVMQSAAESVTDCTLELGGNDPAIVLPGSPVEVIAGGLFFGSFINAGQTCGAIKRIYVHNDDHDALAAAMAEIARHTRVGHGTAADSAMGPLQNGPQHKKVKALTDAAVAAGATLMAGGKQVGERFALSPAILGNCTQDMDIVRLEQFGPAIPLVRYDSLDEAVAMANDSEFGLCASVWGDPGRAADIADRLVAGTVYINTHAELHPMVPFGGRKSSGIGVQFGEEGLKAFTDAKVVYERSGS